jgi:CRP-like cAMP-binding protein
MRTVERLQKNGRVSSKEAAKMRESIEERMKKLMYSSTKMELPKTKEILKDINWLKSVSEETYNKVAELFQYQVYSLGEYLIKENTPADSVFVIVRGTVQVSSGGKAMRMRGPGDTLGVINVLTDQVNKESVITESPVTVLRIKYVKLQRLLNESKELEESLWDAAARNIAELVIKSDARYDSLGKNKLKAALDNGVSYKLKEGQEVKASNMLAILIDGKVYASKDSKKEKIVAPTMLHQDSIMATPGRIFGCVLNE